MIEKVIYPCFFAFNISANILTLLLQCALTCAIERKVVLVGYACFRPPITMKFHNLHVGDIKRVKGEITSYHEKDWFSPFFGFVGCTSFDLPFCFLCDGFNHWFL